MFHSHWSYFHFQKTNLFAIATRKYYKEKKKLIVLTKNYKNSLKHQNVDD
jgi:hypothetical protein